MNMQSENSAAESALIPMSLIVSIAGSLVGGILWLSAMWHKAEASAAEIGSVKIEVSKLQLDVIDRLARIETKLDQIKNKESNNNNRRENAN